MKKARIVERIHPDGTKVFVIQQRHIIFPFWWVDASENHICHDQFKCLADAKVVFCKFDGSKYKDKIVYYE